MGRWGRCDYRELKKLDERLQQLSEVDMDRLCRDAAKKIAQILLNKVKKRTPVGVVPPYATDEAKEEYWPGYRGGSLRDAWTILPIEKHGDQYTVTIINNLEYASYVEYGHRQTPGRYVPALGKTLKASWVKGRFMLTISEQEVKTLAPSILNDMPITPSKVTVKINNQNKTMTLINGEEINILKAAGLSDVSFELVLPQVSYPFSNGGAQSAAYYLSLFERLKVSKTPFQFILNRQKPGGGMFHYTNLTVGLETYEITDDAGEGFDVKVKINLKQYRAYGTKTVTVQPAKTSGGTATATVKAAPRPTTTAPKAATYTVKSGDCLWNIAKKQLGNGADYTKIYNLNKDKIKNPNLIYPGQVLTLPS